MSIDDHSESSLTRRQTTGKLRVIEIAAQLYTVVGSRQAHSDSYDRYGLRS
jgi:hypothetical protein